MPVSCMARFSYVVPVEQQNLRQIIREPAVQRMSKTNDICLLKRTLVKTSERLRFRSVGFDVFKTFSPQCPLPLSTLQIVAKLGKIGECTVRRNIHYKHGKSIWSTQCQAANVFCHSFFEALKSVAEVNLTYGMHNSTAELKSFNDI